MKKIELKSIAIKNFKGIASFITKFNNGKNEIYADVMQGKSSIKDAYLFALGVDIDNFFPLDKNNKPIQGIETFVELVLSVNDLDYVVSRGAKVKYKKNKETNENVFDGYKKDIYSFDKVPCNSSEYKSKIANLFGVNDFNLLKVISVLNYFNEQLNWKERRELIYDLFADKNAIETLKTKEEYNLISNELLKGKSSYEIKAMLNAEENEIVQEKRKAEILIQDNKKELNLLSYDKDLNYEETLISIEEQINEESARLSNLNVNEEKAKIEKEISQINIKRLELEKEDNDYKKSLMANVSELEFKSYHIKDIGRMSEYQISTNTKKYKELKDTTFDMGAKTCPACGQAYPQEYVDNVRSNWEKEKEEQLAYYKNEILKYKHDYEEYKEKYSNIMSKLEIEKEKLNAFKPNPKIEEIKNQILEIAKTIPSSNYAKDDTKLKELIRTKYSLIESMGVKNTYFGLLNKVEELETQLKELINKEILLAKKRAQLEEYSINVVRLIDNSINKNFNFVEFKMFDVLTQSANRDIKETCVVTHNGIDYTSQSTGEKANTNCIIVSTLQNALGINTPIWLDDASILNLTNEPNNQLIFLLNEKGAKLNYQRIRDIY